MGVAGLDQLGREALGLPAKRPVAIEDERPILGALQQPFDFRDVGHVQMSWPARLRRDVLSARDMTY